MAKQEHKITGIFVLILLVSLLLNACLIGRATASGTGSRPDVYELWRVSPGAPYSITFKRDCIEAEDSAAHLKLVEYGRGHVVYGCKSKGY